MRELPLVSVIITTKNEEKNIGNCLESIKKQSYPQNSLETIVIDNNSTDRTKGIAKKYTKNVFNKGPERSAQRNFGVMKSTGKYILYLDADMILTKDVIKECVQELEKNQKLVGLYIPERIIGKGYWISVRNFERSFYNSTVIDCVRFVLKSIFLKVKGFDLNLTGPEDWDFDKKVRGIGEVNIIKSELFHNEGDIKIKKYLKKKKYYSRKIDFYVEKWGKNDPDIKKQLGFFYRSFGVFTENGKWKKLIMNPILTFGMYYLRFRVFLEVMKK